MVHGKLANSRLVLSRQARKRNITVLTDAAADLKRIMQNAATATTLDQLRGFEGAGAKTYFGAVGELLGEAWRFRARKRQPPPDPVNALLSYGYTLLFYNVYALLRARGLNPHVGFLHSLRSGHPALVSDLMEEFRAIIVDTVVLTLILNNRIQPEDFIHADDAAHPCLLSGQGRKTFVSAFEQKMNDPLTHPVTGLHLDYRRCIEAQVQALAAVVRGRQDKYMPLVLR